MPSSPTPTMSPSAPARAMCCSKARRHWCGRRCARCSAARGASSARCCWRCAWRAMPIGRGRITWSTWPRPAASCRGCASRGRRTCTPTSARTRPRWRCWFTPSAGHATASRCTARRSSTSPNSSTWARRSGAARSSRRSVRSGAASCSAGSSTPTGLRSRSCTAAWSAAFTPGTPTTRPRNRAWSASGACASRRGSCC